MKKRVVWMVVAAFIFMLLPMMTGAATHQPGEWRRVIYLQSSPTRVTISQPLVIRCWLDPWDFIGCDTFDFGILVRSVSGSNQLVIGCNGQATYQLQMGPTAWGSLSLGDWAKYLHPGWNTVKIENQTRGSTAEVAQLRVTLIPATWHDEIGQYDNPALQLRAYRGLIHCHTNLYPRDDGSVSLAYYASLAAQRGWDFVIPTGHNPTAAQQWLLVQECNRLSTPGRVIIPGAEISTTWKLSTYSRSNSHALLLYYFGSPFMEQLQGREDYQQYVNRYANTCGALTIAAHPFLTSNLPFRFDFRSTSASVMTKGIECFNSVTSGQEEETFRKILEFTRNKQLCIVTSGCDFHNQFDPKAEERLERLTEVFATEKSVAAIMRALIYGRTCATAKQAYLEWGSYLPGARESVVSGAPNLVFDVRFGGRKNTTATFELYRDGNPTPIATSSKKVKGTNVKVRFQFRDAGASRGQHWYIMRAKNFIVTSPIIINRY